MSQPATLACPSCNRPNSEGRTQCLYCGKELPVAKDATLRPNPKVVKRAGIPGFHLLLLPAAAEGGYEDRAQAPAVLESLREKFAVDRYQWGQWLKMRVFRLLRSYKDRNEASEAAQFLQGLGLSAVVVSNSGVLPRLTLEPSEGVSMPNWGFSWFPA